MNTVCEVRVPITLDQPRTLIFNFNTVAAFDAASTLRYWAFVGDIIELQSKVVQAATERWIAANPGQPVKPELVTFNYIDIMRDLSMEQFRLLVWAALHVYGPNNKMKHPLSLEDIGRCIPPLRTIEVFRSVVKGLLSNNPTSEELGEVSAPAGAAVKPKPTVAIETAETTAPSAADGGTPSIELVADDFA